MSGKNRYVCFHYISERILNGLQREKDILSGGDEDAGAI